MPSIIIDSGSNCADQTPSAYHSVYVLPLSDITSLPTSTASEPSRQDMSSSRSSVIGCCVPSCTMTSTFLYMALHMPSASIISVYMLPFSCVCTEPSATAVSPSHQDMSSAWVSLTVPPSSPSITSCMAATCIALTGTPSGESTAA